MADSSFHVVVIGGGIGGLCLAQGLKKAGVPVSVYERDRTPTSRLQGYRIHVSPRGARSLRECLPGDLWDAFEASCGKSPHYSFRFITYRMEELLRIEAPEDAGARRHYSASRGRLRQTLLAGLDDVVHFDRAFTRYEELSDGRVRAFFEDGSSADGDVLVAADGGNSRVRKQFLPGAQRVDTGIRALGGKVVLTRATSSSLPTALLEGPTLVRAPGGRAMFLAVQELGEPNETKGGRDHNGSAPPRAAALRFDDESSYLMWALSARGERSGFPSEPGQMEAGALREFALKACSGWHPGFSTMIRMTDPSSIGVITIRTSVPVGPWPSGRITLIGDAIHSMTPYRGIGGNVALRDASLLGRNLAAAHRGEMPLLRAIHEYESAMRDYGFRAVRSSLQAAEQAHAEGALAFALGNLFFRIVNAMPPLKARMMRGDADD
jgi:2-polyprenyl-6-methoxyphenol hydroxylase-like FAD-dependent oxidoreductase